MYQTTNRNTIYRNEDEIVGSAELNDRVVSQQGVGSNP